LLLAAEARGSFGNTVRGTSAIGSRYQTMTGEHTADWEDLVRAAVYCRVCELAIALSLLVVTICKCSVNPITNPNPLHSHSFKWQYVATWLTKDGVWIGNQKYWTLTLVTTNNCGSVTELHTPMITVTAGHIKSSQSSLDVAW
jgi:hypothetical protein